MCFESWTIQPKVPSKQISKLETSLLKKYCGICDPAPSRSFWEKRLAFSGSQKTIQREMVPSVNAFGLTYDDLHSATLIKIRI